MRIVYYTNINLNAAMAANFEANVREKLKLTRNDGLLVIQTHERVPEIMVLPPE